MFEENKKKKKVAEFANFIVNNLSFGQSVNILVEHAKEAAEYMIDNDCEMEDFHIYLDKTNREGANVVIEKKEGFLTGIYNKLFKKNQPMIEERVREKTRKDYEKKPFSIRKRGPGRKKK